MNVVGSEPASSKKNHQTSNLRIPVPPSHLELNNPETKVRFTEFTALFDNDIPLSYLLKIAILFLALNHHLRFRIN